MPHIVSVFDRRRIVHRKNLPPVFPADAAEQ
jgi:hypothetical protein